MGRYHAQKLAARGDCALVAVADADRARAEALAAAHGCAALSDYRGIFGLADAAVVAVPTERHREIAGACLEAGLHVLVEKPIASDLRESDELLSLARRNRRVLHVGHVERCNAAFRALAARMQRPLFIDAERLSGFKQRGADVDVVLDLMIHDIDLALTLAASPAVAVEASGVPVFSPLADAAEARVTFANGIVATLAASRVAAVGERVVRVTEQGRALIADFGAPNLTIIDEADGSVRSDALALTRTDSLAAEIADFLESIATGKPPLVGGEAGLDAVKVADMIRAAIARRAAAPISPDRRT